MYHLLSLGASRYDVVIIFQNKNDSKRKTSLTAEHLEKLDISLLSGSEQYAISQAVSTITAMLIPLS